MSPASLTGLIYYIDVSNSISLYTFYRKLKPVVFVEANDVEALSPRASHLKVVESVGNNVALSMYAHAKTLL